MRAAALEQLAGGQADSETMEIANVLVSIPPEFSPGKTGPHDLLIGCSYAARPQFAAAPGAKLVCDKPRLMQR